MDLPGRRSEQLPALPVDAPHPALVPAHERRALVGAGADDARSWLRFDPWQARFVVPPGARPGTPPADMPAPVGIDRGAFVWLRTTDNARSLAGFRSDTRERFAFDVAPLLRRCRRGQLSRIAGLARRTRSLAAARGRAACISTQPWAWCWAATTRRPC